MSVPAHTVSIHTTDEDATLRLGAALGRALRAGDAVGLRGDLGAGKTTFVRGVAEGVGTLADTPVCSPTFTIVNIYPGPITLYHVDLYRLGDEDDLESIGYREYDDGEGALLVEWCDRIPTALPPDHLLVDIGFDDVAARRFVLHPSGPRAAALLERLELPPDQE